MAVPQAELRAVFCEAGAGKTPQEQAEYLDQTCKGKPELRARVEALLRADREAGDFLREPSGPLADSAGAEVGPGKLIGSYELLEEIGEGGFGLVFLAEQHHPVRRKVAIKVLKPGMDSRQIIARFEAESQALALMDHPNIARVLEAGETALGRPYFVMELTRGVPITDYCDQNGLGAPQRLELFLGVCEAVQHAHQKGIIHRDIKPSNVLVTLHDGVPVVKVIDFGIAKAIGQPLTDKTLHTGISQMIGTPLYMSPEQAEGSPDVDTRSDIYSLGVLLYELLTGTTPFDKQRLREAGHDEMRRIIREEEPPRPSARLTTLGPGTTAATPRQRDPQRLSRLIRGELDWIVMKALEKDRRRRYQTANSFAADVQRYLHDEPVSACPPSAWYRFRKFTRRHRTALMTASVITVALVLAAGSIGWVVRDRDAREAALDREEDRAVDQAGTLIQAGKWPEAAPIVERAEKFLVGAGRARLPVRLQELKRDLEMARRLEDVYSQPHDFAGHRQDGEYARAFREFGIDVATMPVQEAAERIGERSIRTELAAALDIWSILCLQSRDNGKILQKRLLDVARTTDSDPWRNRLRDAMLRKDATELPALAAATDMGEISPGSVRVLSQALTQLLDARKAAVDLLRRAQQQYPADPWINFDLGESCHITLQKDDALRFYTVAAALRPDNVHIIRAYGAALQTKGALREARAQYSRALGMQPDNMRAWWNRADVHMALAEPEAAIADYAKAFEHQPVLAIFARSYTVTGWKKTGLLERALVHYTKAVKVNPLDARALHLRALTYECLGEWDKAITDHTRAIELDGKSAVLWRSWYCRALAHETLKQWDSAIADYGKVIELERPAGLPWHPWLRRGIHQATLGHWQKAIADYSRAIELNADGSFRINNNSDTLAGRAFAYAMLNQWAKAATDAEAAAGEQPANEIRWMELVAFRLQAGDHDGYLKACKDMLERFDKPPLAWWTANRLGLSCLLLPDGCNDPKVRARLAAAANAPKDPLCLITRGIVLYRDGQFKPAAEQFHLVLKKYPEESHAALGPDGVPVMSWLFLAMANQQLGQPKEARQWLTKAVESMDKDSAAKLPGPLRQQSHVWAICLVLRREAEGLLKK